MVSLATFQELNSTQKIFIGDHLCASTALSSGETQEHQAAVLLMGNIDWPVYLDLCLEEEQQNYPRT